MLAQIVKLSKTEAWVTLHDHDIIVEHCNFFLSALNELMKQREKQKRVEKKEKGWRVLHYNLRRLHFQVPTITY